MHPPDCHELMSVIMSVQSCGRIQRYKVPSSYIHVIIELKNSTLRKAQGNGCEFIVVEELYMLNGRAKMSHRFFG